MTRFLAPALIAVLTAALLVLHHHKSPSRELLGPSPVTVIVPARGVDPLMTEASSRRVHTPRRTHHRIPLIWRQLAFCESSGRWHIVNPPYSGGLQFKASTWTSFDVRHYAPTADQATRWQQVQVARHVLRVQGWAAWPVCSVKVGLR